jgi:hypothetical protein
MVQTGTDHHELQHGHDGTNPCTLSISPLNGVAILRDPWDEQRRRLGASLVDDRRGVPVTVEPAMDHLPDGIVLDEAASPDANEQLRRHSAL